ncbi:hypothetical protein [Streptomyces sp. HNM0574]|uniref:hypothetical protein n=1 Tax=Streptomyces sp. HNM0574 TaxID=2714954 RepID=UPI00146B9B3A|nr:hypothetical protein [Streptomyces sp. HNM0574]
MVIGRKRTLTFTMGLMGGSTALIGLLPTDEQAGPLAPAGNSAANRAPRARDGEPSLART